MEWAKIQTLNELLKLEKIQTSPKEFDEMIKVKEFLLSKIHEKE